MRTTALNFLSVLLATVVFCCNQRTSRSELQETKSTPPDTLLIECDSIYKEKGYFVQLISFDSLLDKEHNSILLFAQKTKDGIQQLYIDTLYSKVGDIKFADYNNDNIKDILVQNISDVGSNWTYNLFLMDFKDRTLLKVKGFQEIKNPKLNEDLGIIESYVSSGTNYFEFYKLLTKDSIYKYDILIYDSLDETIETNYKQALEKIKWIKH